jgi:hypothetical protein
MAVDAPTPLPGLPSAQERERVVRLLRDGCAEERLSLDAFSARIRRAYDARSRPQLEELVADLPQRRCVGELIAGGVARLSRFVARVEAAWLEPRVPRLALPAAQTRATIGRARDCDWLLHDETVSRRHASVRRSGERWLLRDLGSLNGTRVNGRRIVEEVEVRPGDRVSFGAARFRLAEPQL